MLFPFLLSYKNKLQKQLKNLKDDIPVVEIKGGTEIEDMSHQELYFLREITEDILPLKIKIGGVEARNDIRFCLKNKIDTILAPMVESGYALKIFIQSVDSIYKDLPHQKSYFPKKAINIETIMAIKNFEEIIKQEEFKHISQVTIGRSDLSSSLDKDVMSKLVFQKTKLLLKRLHSLKKITSIGGDISIFNVPLLVKEIKPIQWNTRHIVIENSQDFQKNAYSFIQKILSFEMLLCFFLGKVFPLKKIFYEDRMRV